MQEERGPTESDFTAFLVSLLNQNPNFRNINVESLISSRLRADILAEQHRNNTWQKILIEVKSFATFTEKRSQDILEQLSAYKQSFTEPVRLVLAFPENYQ
jgi:hypothetical protein